MIKKVFVCALLCLMCLSGCQATQDNSDKRSDDVVVLFTNDIHGGIDEGITMAGVSSYKKYLETKNKYVLMVDCGDAVQGSVSTLATSGQIAVDVMNAVGYDYAICGNHEFDYGIDRLNEIINSANAQYLDCNISYTGQNESIFTNKVKPYDIRTFGDIKVGFIGITTPNTIVASVPSKFEEDGKIVLDFYQGDNGKKFYDQVQKTVDEVREKGADYVVALAHLGINETEDCEYTSYSVISNTNGIDVLLDGHSHSVFEKHCLKNKDGEYVIAAQTGTKLENLGKLVIGKGGTISVSLIDDICEADEEVEKVVEKEMEEFNEIIETPICSIDFDIMMFDENGVRLARNRETAIGDLVTDAYRYVTGSDIAYNNGGGLRNNIDAGIVTLEDVINVCPFGNLICEVEVTGQEIVDFLEHCVRKVEKYYVDDKGVALGENGPFPCVSGLKFVVNTDVKSSCEEDENSNLLGVGDTRRVSDVMVEENGEYVPIDLNKTYKLASTNYVIKQGGSGTAFLLEKHNVTINDLCTDYEAIVKYINDGLNNDLSKYRFVDDRITIK